MERNRPELWPPSSDDPLMASSEVPNYPGLVQWLALADAKQCDPLINVCMGQFNMWNRFSTSSYTPQHARKAMASPDLNKIVSGLRSETKDRIIQGLLGLPAEVSANG